MRTFLEDLGVPAYKIASGDLKNTPLLEHVAQFGKPMIVSTGASVLEDVKRAYDTIMPINPQLCLMQCTAGYPAEFEELDLGVVAAYKDLFPEVVNWLLWPRQQQFDAAGCLLSRCPDG